MKKAFILHTVEDAKHCVQNGFYREGLLFSTHSSVDVYLKEHYEIECRCLSWVLEPHEVSVLREESFEIAGEILNALDASISPVVNSQLNVNMRYFFPLYSYLGKYHIFGYSCFVEAVRKVTRIYSLSKVLFYDRVFNDFFQVNSNMEYFTSSFFADMDSQVIRLPYHKNASHLSCYERIVHAFRRITGNPGDAVQKARGILYDRFQYRKFSRQKKAILLHEPLYNLQFLLKYLQPYNILFYKDGALQPLGFKHETLVDHVNVDFLDAGSQNNGNPCVQIFLKEVHEDFQKNIVRYANAVLWLKEFHKRWPISLGIWGNPPCRGTKALIFEFLRSEGIKVLGGQHGTLYGEIYEPLHLDSDLSRCNYFISYGVTKEDFNRVYKQTEIPAQIVPCGMASLQKKRLRKKDIDILFPVSNALTMFNGGMIRVHPHKLTERQAHLLEYLNTLKELEIYIKPFVGSSYRNCSILPLLKRLKNLKVVDNLTLQEFLDRYNPMAVVLDFPTQPLVEVMRLDTEIFLLDNDRIPYELEAFEKLCKRVHYFDDDEEAISKIRLFLEGKLERKRDDAFYNHYVYRDHANENILRFIDAAAKGDPVFQLQSSKR